MGKTNISWTDFSWNPYLWRCRKVSPGCANCYMHALAARLNQDPNSRFGTRWPAAEAELRRIPPGSLVFVNSMSDTYYEAAPDADVHRVHNTALARPDLLFLVLTKRPERAYYMRHILAWPSNLWLGVSVESADYLWRIDYALATPAAGVFVSAEPLLGQLSGLSSYLAPRVGRTAEVPLDVWKLGSEGSVEWVIVGGESGPSRRWMDRGWAREIRWQCQRSTVPFFYKQGNAAKPGQDRELDGQLWEAYPAAFHEHRARWGNKPLDEAVATAPIEPPAPVVEQMSLF